MSAPEHVPTEPDQLVRSYSSPPWRPDPWFPDRPGELSGRQPFGDALGVPGPDQGYALKLASRYRGRLSLVEGEDEDDAIAGAVAVATKRAALFGRAPILHDVTVGLAVWGFLDPSPPAPLVELRRGRVFDHLRQLQQQGKIKAFGASVESMDEAIFCLEQEGMASLQIIFNIFRQKPIDALFERAKARGVALVVRLPLASGMLSGKLTAASTKPFQVKSSGFGSLAASAPATQASWKRVS